VDLRVLRRSVPTLITLARAGLLVPFWRLAVDDHRTLAAGGVLAVLGTTDFLDGYAARHLDAVTTLGKVLDPTLDRAALLVAWLVALADHLFPVWLLVWIVARELLVSIVTIVDLVRFHHRQDVVFVGKAGTFGLLAAFPLALVGRGLELGLLGATATLVALVAVGLLTLALAHYVAQLGRDLGRLSASGPQAHGGAPLR
jgi:cardiolipin synthase